jgi:hypothetical protein
MTREDFGEFLDAVEGDALNAVAQKLQMPRDSAQVKEAVQRAATYCLDRIEQAEDLGRDVRFTKSYFIQKARNEALDAIKTEATRRRILKEATDSAPFREGWNRGNPGHQTAHTVGRQRFIRDDDPEDCLGEDESDSFADRVIEEDDNDE